MIRVLLADDHDALREGVRYMLSLEPARFAVYPEEAVNGVEAVNLYRTLLPDVLLMDVKMPTMTGVDAAIEILQKDPDANIVLFSAHDEPAMLTRALRAGCRGYVLKNAHANDVMAAIEAVANGSIYIDPELMPEIIAPVTEVPDLTPREVEVLTLLGRGYSTTQVAQEMTVTTETVRTHVKHARVKLSADNKTHAVALALIQGLIDLT